VTPPLANPLRFGAFELDIETNQLRKEGRVIRLQPQPFKLLWLLASRPARVLSRQEIKEALWTGDTFIDFEQGVNFAIKQVREALGDDSENPLYIQTVPKRGYRFIAPVEGASGPKTVMARAGTTDLNLQKVLWTNIAELRLAEAQRKQQMRMLVAIASAVGAALVVAALWWALR
jgi:DNA-binding winged helix-turn-helix (wHTH) protein